MNRIRISAASQLKAAFVLFFSPSAVLYHRWGKLELAKKHYELSLKLDPEAPGTRDNYNMLRRKLDQLKRSTPWGNPLWLLPTEEQIVSLDIIWAHTNSGFETFGNKDHDLLIKFLFCYLYNKHKRERGKENVKQYNVFFASVKMCIDFIRCVQVRTVRCLCCFVAPFEGHVDLIHVEPRSLFIFDPMLCQLDRAPCTCRGSAVTFIWLGPFSGVPNVPTLKR